MMLYYIKVTRQVKNKESHYITPLIFFVTNFIFYLLIKSIFIIYNRIEC